jgi:hypothetical protein
MGIDLGRAEVDRQLAADGRPADDRTPAVGGGRATSSPADGPSAPS